MSNFTKEDLMDIAYRGSYEDLERNLARQLLACMEQEPVAWWTGPEPTLTGEVESIHDHETGSHYIPLYPICAAMLHSKPESVPQLSRMSGIIPDYEGVAMTQRECYMAGKEAGLAEARKSLVITDGCMWTYCEHDYYWESSCGESWTFIEDGPEENGVKFCHGCGRPVLITAAPQEVK